MILNLLLPGQVATGALLWEAGRYPALIERLGGLFAIASVHVAAAWLFVAFIVMHVYSMTTGPLPLAQIRSMISSSEYESDRDAERTSSSLFDAGGCGVRLAALGANHPHSRPPLLNAHSAVGYVAKVERPGMGGKKAGGGCGG